MTNPEKIPTVALVLGVAGLVPFLACASALMLSFPLPLIGAGSELRRALIIYAVAILSFLGGVRWGIAMGYSDSKLVVRDLVISVVPALVGWWAALLSPRHDLWVMAVAFVALGLLDYGLACRTVAPEWYGRLRLALSAAVAVILGLAAFA
ncbi:DUF3429 domain-containing protein [Phreatobacter aquaticus]|uniref:DUF3429 domain-containing protein n=1 Tax=Phreatobacter aquaticus TaxID=2570229 RepID=A0A4D7QHV8_9HYPH|nr:DUF3429 domain-containing protein [Phreatobacter aquaticus]QCK85006.1 DUF3429 domain-containing protein [Phreatobacter aquaticus]